MPLPFPLLFSVKRRLNIVLLEVCLGTGRRGTFEGGAIEEYQERTSWGSQETEVFWGPWNAAVELREIKVKYIHISYLITVIYIYTQLCNVFI